MCCFFLKFLMSLLHLSISYEREMFSINSHLAAFAFDLLHPDISLTFLIQHILNAGLCYLRLCISPHADRRFVPLLVMDFIWLPPTPCPIILSSSVCYFCLWESQSQKRQLFLHGVPIFHPAIQLSLTDTQRA